MFLIGNKCSFNEKSIFQLATTKSEEVSSRQKVVRRKIDRIIIQFKLLEEIASTSTYSPSVRKVARDLCIDKRLLYYHFPELCKEISRKHAYVQERKNKRIKNGCDEILKAIKAIQAAGEFPSRTNIEQLLSLSIDLRDKVFREFWKSQIVQIM